MPTQSPKPRTLTAKQQRFVEILPTVNWNATAAYKAAGYAWTSEKMAGSLAVRLKGNDRIQAALAAQKQALAKRAAISQEAVLADMQALSSEAREAKQYSAAIRGTELVGKQIGMWPDKLVVKPAPPELPPEWGEFSLEELKAFVEHRRELRAKAIEGPKARKLEDR